MGWGSHSIPWGIFVCCLLISINSIPAAEPGEEDTGTCADSIVEGAILLPPAQSTWLKETANVFKQTLALPSEAEIKENLFEFLEVNKDAQESYFSILRRYRGRDLVVAQNKMINAFARGCSSRGRIITPAELATDLGIDVDSVRWLFGSGRLFTDVAALKSQAMQRKEGSFKSVMDTDIFNAEKLAALISAIKTHKRLILTTAVAGAPVNSDFLAALLRYADERDAAVIVYPSNMQTTGLDPRLLNDPRIHILTNSIDISPWIRLNKIKIMAKQRNPLMGLDFIGPRGQTQIIGHPQMHLRTIATSANSQYPHRLMTTGALTDPLYSGKRYVSWRTDDLAAEDHVLGAILLERDAGLHALTGLPRSGAYHIRRLEFLPERKGFHDLDRFFGANGSEKIRPKAISLGDIHVGANDEALNEPLREQIYKFKPEYIVLHDVFNGHSLNPHEKDKAITLARLAESGQLSVDAELRRVATFINSLLDIDRSIKIVIVPSNHDYFFTRWLDNLETVKDPGNKRIYHEASLAALDGKDPLEAMLLARGIAYPKRFVFIPRGGGFKVGPDHRLVEVGTHGDAGANGGKGTLKTLRKAFGRILFGHTHTLAWENGAATIGTNTLLVLPYTKNGVSSWVQALAIIDPDGGFQILQFQNENWYLPEGTPQPEKFFPENFPHVIPNNEAPAGGLGQVDQYS